MAIKEIFKAIECFFCQCIPNKFISFFLEYNKFFELSKQMD